MAIASASTSLSSLKTLWLLHVSKELIYYNSLQQSTNFNMRFYRLSEEFAELDWNVIWVNLDRTVKESTLSFLGSTYML